MDAATMENNNQNLQKPKNKAIVCSSNLTAGFITKRENKILIQKVNSFRFHSSIVWNSQDMEKRKYPPTDGWINKMCVCVCVCILIHSAIHTHTQWHIKKL